MARILGEHTVVQNTKTLNPSVPFRAEIVRRARGHVKHKLIKAIKKAEACSPTFEHRCGWRLLPTIRNWTTVPHASMK